MSTVLTSPSIRKSLALLCAATLAVGLAACGGGSSDEASGPTKITVWHGYTDARRTR